MPHFTPIRIGYLMNFSGNNMCGVLFFVNKLSPYLRKIIDSVRAQKHVNFELLIGANVGTNEFLAKLCAYKCYFRVKLLPASSYVLQS